MERPAAIFWRNTLICAAAYALFSAGLAYAIVSGSPRTLTLFIITSTIPPIYVWVTYRECRRAWIGEEPDEVKDTAIPALTVAGFAFLAYSLLS